MQQTLGHVTSESDAAEPALVLIRTLRADFDARAKELETVLAGMQRVEADRLRDFTDQLTRAAEETRVAVEKATRDSAELGRACLEFERAEAQKRLDSALAEVAAAREADRLERVALKAALDDATARLDAAKAAHAAVETTSERSACTEQTDDKQERGADRAQQYARLIVSEITRYPRANVPMLLDPRLSERLTDTIEQWAASPASDHPVKLSKLLSGRT
jgi:membrane protein involved in colicin uptake